MTSVPHSGAKSATPGGSVAGHTRGPWEVLRIEDCLAIMPDPIAGRPDTFLGIALVQEHDGERSAGRVEANARLISAAPELLEALQTIVTDCSQVWSATEFPALQQARAAIAKATAGETRNAEPIHRRDGDAESGGVNP